VADRPRRRALVALAIAGLAGATVVAWIAREPAGAAQELADRLAAGRDLDPFRFEHRAGGTGVLDCVLPNRRISGTVDGEAGLAILRSDAGAEIARKRVDRVLVHRDLFAERAVPTTWLRLALPADGERRAPLAAALGPELAGYVLDRGLPPTGRATALAALDAAEVVVALPEGRLDGYRITVGDDWFGEEAADRAGPGDAGPGAPPPLIDVWLDEDDVVRRVEVVPAQPAGEREAPSGGWTIDYTEATSPVDDRTPTSVTDVTDIDLDRLRASGPDGGCDLAL